MTEKRFTVKKSGNGLFYSDGDYSIDNTIQFVIETVEFKLNQLNDENEQLKKQIGNLEHTRDFCADVCADCERLEEENEQLKQFKEYVFNKIDMHLRMLPTARDNEFNEDDGDPSLYVGAIYMLETLKKELEYD